MRWQKIDFGNNKKVQGKTLPQIMFIDPDWFYHQYLKYDYLKNSKFANESKYIYERSRKIRPPKNTYVKYFLYDDHTFNGITFIEDKIAEEDYSEVMGGTFIQDIKNWDENYFTILKSIDMYFPKRLRNYDKQSYKIFIKDIREYMFEGKRITKQKAEAFFEDDNNFLIN